MSIDWSKAPEGCIGAFARIISKTAFFVFSKRPSDYSSREGYEGEGEDGPYHVFSEYWEWIDKPWDGQGLPPVGTLCEWHGPNSDGPDGWVYTESNVVAYTDDGLFICMQKPGCWPVVQRIDNCEFRPIRTPEQIAAEERRKSILHLANLLIDSRGQCNEYSQAEAIFDAGYRRQEEGK
ncbi:TPA: hypothetical protein SMR00_005586 [Pseudomonas aeruginosa]|nr:hypothetical protein [Pseudomonas aeruginosa]